MRSFCFRCPAVLRSWEKLLFIPGWLVIWQVSRFSHKAIHLAPRVTEPSKHVMQFCNFSLLRWPLPSHRFVLFSPPCHVHRSDPAPLAQSPRCCLRQDTVCIDTFYTSLVLLGIQRWYWFKNSKEGKLIFKCIQTSVWPHSLLWALGRIVTRVFMGLVIPHNRSVHMAYSRGGRATSTECQALGL